MCKGRPCIRLLGLKQPTDMSASSLPIREIRYNELYHKNCSREVSNLPEWGTVSNGKVTDIPEKLAASIFTT